MKNKFLASLIIALVFFASANPAVFATGLKEGTSSLLLPTTGQALNGEIGATKTKIMAGVEAAAIATVAVLGTVTGGGVVWFGIAPLLANHVWSASDAYKTAKNSQDPLVQQQMMAAQRTIDISRQRRFEREQNYRSDVADRVRQAGERSSY